LQSPDATLISSGLHIPLCVTDVSWATNNRGGVSLFKANDEGQSVARSIFEDLFSNSLLGSIKFPAAKLEELYRATGILEGDESIILHAQEYALKAEKPKPKKRKREASQPNVVDSVVLSLPKTISTRSKALAIRT
jgi:hypothetical protein